MAKNFGVECFPRNYCVTFTLCAVIVVLAISCIPQSVHGNHVPQPGSRNANPTRGRNIRPEVRTTPQRRRGSPQQQAPSRAASNSRRFSVQQNARAATQQRASASRRTNQRGEPSSRTRQVGIQLGGKWIILCFILQYISSWNQYTETIKDLSLVSAQLSPEWKCIFLLGLWKENSDGSNP